MRIFFKKKDPRTFGCPLWSVIHTVNFANDKISSSTTKNEPLRGKIDISEIPELRVHF